LCQNRERTGVPTRAARVGWWMRPDLSLNQLIHSQDYFFDPVATAPGSDTI